MSKANFVNFLHFKFAQSEQSELCWSSSLQVRKAHYQQSLLSSLSHSKFAKSTINKVCFAHFLTPSSQSERSLRSLCLFTPTKLAPFASLSPLGLLEIRNETHHLEGASSLAPTPPRPETQKINHPFHQIHPLDKEVFLETINLIQNNPLIQCLIP